MLFDASAVANTNWFLSIRHTNFHTAIKMLIESKYHYIIVRSIHKHQAPLQMHNDRPAHKCPNQQPNTKRLE